MNFTAHIPRGSRFTIGARIENKFLDLIELSYASYFTEKENKGEKILECILVLDTLKFLIVAAWEAKILTHNQFKEIAPKLNEIGKMLGGWRKGVISKTPAK